MDRTQRQRLCIRRWLDCNGKGIIEACTGFGKTFVAIQIIKAFYNRNTNFRVLIAVPTEVLREQWNRELAKNQLFSISKVEIFNTIVKNNYEVDLFIIDEVHLACSTVNINMFNIVKYKYVLGLTATLERLDGKDMLLYPYMSICDTVTLNDALENDWISNYRNYQVLLDVDLTDYNLYDSNFKRFFACFNNDFKLAMSLLSDKRKLKIWCQKTGKNEGVVIGSLSQMMKYLKLRKQFVMSHAKKFEIADKIIQHRSNKKIILFSASIKDSEYFKSSKALILHSKQKKAYNKAVIEKFNSECSGLLSTSKCADAGVDIRGLNVGIIVSGDSSKTRTTQRIGRIIRKEEGKIAEIFTLVIKGTVEESWFNNANKDQSYITINEKELDLVLAYNNVSKRPKVGVEDLINRF